MDQKSIDFEETESKVKQVKEHLNVSIDYDMTVVDTKPLPRQSVEPTFRGWKEAGLFEQADALTEDDEAVDLLSRGSFFDTYLPDSVYGQWYHNVAYVGLVGFLSWTIGWFGFSIGPIFFVMLITAILYRSSVRAYRQRLRDQAQREFSVKSIENDYETVDWLNVLMTKFWYYLEPSIAQILSDQVNITLAASPAPGFIKAIWLDTFTLGTKPPRIDMAKTLDGTSDDVVVMDWGCSFTPSDLSDSNNKQKRNRVDQKLIVRASFFGFSFPVVVSSVAFKCLLRVRMRMMSAFPHVETISVSLIEPPLYDFTCRFFGDSVFNWEVLAFPGLLPLINEMIKKYLGPILFAPLSFQLNVQQIMAGAPFNSAIGVLVVKLKSAKDLKNYGRIGNTIDPYCTVGFFKEVLAKSRHISDTSTPRWDQTLEIPISTLSEPLSITVMDYNGNQSRKSHIIGTVQYDLDILTKIPEIPDISAAIVRNNKHVGQLLFGLHFLPTLIAQREADGAVIPPPDLNTGVVRIEITSARNLKGKEGVEVATYAEVFLDKKILLTTPVVTNNDPIWGTAKEAIISKRAKTKVKIVLRTKEKTVYSCFTSTLNSLIDACQVDDPWFQLAKGGEIQINTFWKPVELGGASGAGDYTPPIGVVRIAIEKAEDLPNLETIGKVDPYVRIFINGIERGRTVNFESTLNPVWNEVHYCTVSSANQKLTLEAMDVERHSPDRTLGKFDVNLRDIIRKDEKGNYIENSENVKRTSKLVRKKTTKGSITYSVSFYPTLPVLTRDELREEEERNKIAERKEKEAEKQETQEKEDQASRLSSENLYESDDEETDEFRSKKLRLDLEQLLEYKSGVLVYEIHSILTSKSGSYLQVYFDNSGLCDFVTPKLKNCENSNMITGDAIIKELEWSETCFRVVKKRDANRGEKPICDVKVPTLQLLKNGFSQPYNIDLSSGTAQITIQTSWIPIIYSSEIPPQDSYKNMGVVKIQLLHAENLPAGDRNGKSDPYVKLYLNKEDSFFKSRTIKKTLNPTWNESTSVETINKYDSSIRVECYDWDVGPEKDDSLGSGTIMLTKVTPNEEIEIEVPLKDEQEQDAGLVHFKVGFSPKFILNVGTRGSTVAGALGLVGSGVEAGVGTVGFVGKGVTKGVGKGINLGVGTVSEGLKKGLSLSKKDK